VKLKRSTNEPQKKRSRPASIDAVIDALTSYVKGQLLRPLSGAGRWLLFGIVGGVLVGAGVVFMLLGLLRLLQTELSGISTADSRLSWLPYLIVLVIGVGVLIVTLQRINRTELFSDREQERVSE
jgi:TRAP-type C4-dicarboxylate transport system permease small subunit